MTVTDRVLPSPLLTEHVMMCPGCRNWQMHYTWMAFSDLITWRVPASASEPLVPDLTGAKDAIEGLLREHVSEECVNPLLVMAAWHRAKKKW